MIFMEHKVAIITANYNYGQYILEAINSIQRQTYNGPIRMYLVDDGSSDDSWDKICKITQEDSSEDMEEGYYTGPIESRIGKNIFAYRITNSGASTARNVAIWKAWEWADVFGVLDSDDEYKPNKVEVLMNKLMEYGEIGVACSDYDIHNELPHRSNISYEFKNSYCRNELMNRCIIHSNSLIKKAYLAQIILPNKEIFDSQLHGPASQGFIGCTEDYDLWIRLSKICIFTHVAESLAIARQNGQNQSMKMTTDVFNQNAKILSSR
jgi:glycosyltransferase involved in cell wall biosynthesis